MSERPIAERLCLAAMLLRDEGYGEIVARPLLSWGPTALTSSRPHYGRHMKSSALASRPIQRGSRMREQLSGKL